jgi:hypothetical protein
MGGRSNRSLHLAVGANKKTELQRYLKLSIH